MKSLPFNETHELDPTGEWWVLKDQFKGPYRESAKKQLESWLNGKPNHNDYSDECCPDFSCCSPQDVWPMEMRERFVNGTEEEREEMMMACLSTRVTNENVYVSKGIPPNRKLH